MLLNNTFKKLSFIYFLNTIKREYGPVISFNDFTNGYDNSYFVLTKYDY